MKKSFDEILKNRLEHYTYPVAPEMKDVVLSKAKRPFRILPYFILTLLLLSVSVVGLFTQRKDIKTDHPQLPDLQGSISSTFAIAPPTQKEPVKGPEIEKKSSDPVIATSSSEPAQSFESPPEKLEPIIATGFGNKGFPGKVSVGISRILDKKHIIPKSKKQFTPYYGIGGFFLYNRLKPNVQDDLFIGEYDAPYSLSLSRIGLALESGVQMNLSERSFFRLGLLIANYSQSYSFLVHGIKPDSVAIDPETGYLEPFFDSQKVNISKRITVPGIRLQYLSRILPNKYDALFFSLEYSRLITETPSFTYKSKKYEVMDSNLFFIEAGLHKTIFQFGSQGISLTPTIRYSISDTGKGRAISVQPFSVGVTASYSFQSL